VQHTDLGDHKIEKKQVVCRRSSVEGVINSNIVSSCEAQVLNDRSCRKTSSKPRKSSWLCT
jgi:hypothetical protein